MFQMSEELEVTKTGDELFDLNPVGYKVVVARKKP
jgi:hypothetical protein